MHNVKPPGFPLGIYFMEDYPSVLNRLQYWFGYKPDDEAALTEILSQRIAFIIDVCMVFPEYSNYEYGKSMREVWILTNGYAVVFSTMDVENKFPAPFKISNDTEEIITESIVVSQCYHRVKTIKKERKYYFSKSENIKWSQLRDSAYEYGTKGGPILWGYYGDYLVNTNLYIKTFGQLITYLKNEKPTKLPQALEMINALQKIMEREKQLIAQKIAQQP